MSILRILFVSSMDPQRDIGQGWHQDQQVNLQLGLDVGNAYASNYWSADPRQASLPSVNSRPYRQDFTSQNEAQMIVSQYTGYPLAHNVPSQGLRYHLNSESSIPMSQLNSLAAKIVNAPNMSQQAREEEAEEEYLDMIPQIIDHNGKRYAGWAKEEEATQEKKDYIAEYLIDKWGYSHLKDGIKRTKARMAEMIGHKEAAILLNWKQNPRKAAAIAKATRSRAKDDERPSSTLKGRQVLELLHYQGMSRTTISKYINDYSQCEPFWSQEPKVIAQYIFQEYLDTMARLGRTPTILPLSSLSRD